MIYIYLTTMQKQAGQENAWGEVQLNQRGRPKQKVIFYKLTQEMRVRAEEELSKEVGEITQEDYLKLTAVGQKVWDKFYQFHKCNFFKDRTYLEREMPQITFFRQYYQLTGKSSNYYELGCGVGNTLFPLLRQFDFFNYFGCDISGKAIALIEQEMQKHPDLIPRMNVCVCDLVIHPIPYPQLGDLNSLIFVLSAIAPEQHLNVMQKVADSMKPGSFLFFRDYGRYDFGQLNLSSKGNRKLKDNFYRKNDGVCVYYFQEDELKNLCQKAGLATIRINFHCKLLQNRKTGLKMYRNWIQGRFYKPPLDLFFEQRVKIQLQKQLAEEKEEELNAKQQMQIESQQKVQLVSESLENKLTSQKFTKEKAEKMQQQPEKHENIVIQPSSNS